VALAVLTADCLPIFIADPAGHAICVLHAGKVGTRKQIASSVGKMFRDRFGSAPERAVALIGPSIGDGCYPQRLWEANSAQLKGAGIEDPVLAGLCTRCNPDNFYSYRAEKGFTGRMLSAIILTGE